ncbi:MAG: heavy metal-binding domain-containing protein [Bacteroidota bacterium]
MKKIINFRQLALSIVFIVFTACTAYSQSADSTHKMQKKETVINKSKTSRPAGNIFYTCPTHPKVRSDRAGNCPQCGITLNRKTEKVHYACPQHAEVKHDDKGQCEKCGIALEQKE